MKRERYEGCGLRRSDKKLYWKGGGERWVVLEGLLRHESDEEG